MAIDGNTNNAKFDQNHCMALGDEVDDAAIDDGEPDDEGMVRVDLL